MALSRFRRDLWAPLTSRKWGIAVIVKPDFGHRRSQSVDNSHSLLTFVFRLAECNVPFRKSEMRFGQSYSERELLNMLSKRIPAILLSGALAAFAQEN